MEIKWQRSKFYQFRAITKIHLGALEQDIFPDDIVEFDGQVARFGGREEALSSLRGGVKAGWLVPISDTTSVYKPQPADVKVRPATSAGQERGDPMPVEMATEEEALVGTLEGHQKRRESSFTGQIRKPPQTPVYDQVVQQQPVSLLERRAALEAQMAALEVQRAALELEGAAEAQLAPVLKIAVQQPDIAPLAPRGRRPYTVEEADEINRQRIEAATSVPVPPRAEPLPEMTPEERLKFQGAVNVEEQSGVAVGGYKFSNVAVGAEGETRAQGVDVTKVSAAGVDAAVRPIGTPPRATQVPEAGNISITETLPGGATGDVAEAQSGESLVGLLGGAAVAGPDPSNPLGWDTSSHWKTRVKTAVDMYGDSPEQMGQILAVETPTVRKHIQTEMQRRHN